MPTPSISINSAPYEAMGPHFLNGAAPPGTYYTLPPFGDPPMVGPRNYDEVLIKWPGVNFVGTKRAQSFTRPIHINLIIVDNSLANMIARQKTLNDGLEQLARFDIVLHGTTYHGCKLVFGTGMPVKETYPNQGLCLVCPYDFIQLSETN